MSKYRVAIKHTSGWEKVLVTIGSQSDAEFMVRNLNKPLPLLDGDVPVLAEGWEAYCETLPGADVEHEVEET